MGSSNFAAIHALSSSGIGVYGNGPQVGVEGQGGSVGVAGFIGLASASPEQAGVRGANVLGTGVRGEGKPGVYGICTMENGSGVRGDGNAPGSIGVFAKNIGTRRALRTKGRVQMDTVRKKTLANKSNLISLPTGVNAGSNAAVLATMQGNPGNDAAVQRAFRVDAKHIRIAFNKKPANPVSVAYWVVHPA